jgi:hypothetical protein
VRSRNAISVPSESATTEYAPSSRASRGDRVVERRRSFAISAAITSLSESSTAARRPPSLLAQLGGVRRGCRCAERDRARAAVVEQRLRVRPGVAPVVE